MLRGVCLVRELGGNPKTEKSDSVFGLRISKSMSSGESAEFLPSITPKIRRFF